MIVVVSGIARHSLGSALVELLLRNGVNVVGVDVEANSQFEEQPAFRFVYFDLNPLREDGNWRSYSDRLRGSLKTATSSLGEDAISALIQSAGAYWSGEFLGTPSTSRASILGVNVIARVELLHAVMTLNAESGFLNKECLTHIDIGSRHGVFLSRGRSLYGASKAFGLQLATAMNLSGELRRSIYVAPGPIDTYMLHFNHWVVKSGGASSFIENLRRGDPSVYDAVFRKCSDSALLGFNSSIEVENQAAELLRTYKFHRDAAFASDVGVISVDDCADLVHSFAVSDGKSGIYVVTQQPEAGLTVQHADFKGAALPCFARLD